MGLSNAIAGGIIMFGITYVMFTFGGLTDQAASFSDTSSETTKMESRLLKTSISTSLSNPGETSTFSFDITNNNLEKLWEFDKFDIIITYDISGTKHIETLSHDTACPPTSGEWCINTWTNDVLDPEILNEGETITVNVEIENSLITGSELVVIVSTQNGVVSSSTITV